MEYPERVLTSEMMDMQSPCLLCPSLLPSTLNDFVGPRLSLSESEVILDLMDLGVSGAPGSVSDILPKRSKQMNIYVQYIYAHAYIHFHYTHMYM